jgi:salicylate hydroxylase
MKLTTRPQGYACFRAFFPATHLRDDPLASPYTKEECVNFWIGSDVHLVQNTLRGGEEFNWILTHKDTADITESWFQPGDMDAVRDIVQTLDPEIRSVIEGTESCLDWKIVHRDPIPSWVSPRGQRVVLLGDSCHPHLPTSAQGASQATESAGVLAVCLGLAGKENVPLAVSEGVNSFWSCFPGWGGRGVGCDG